MRNLGPHNGRYILVGQTPVPCEDLLEWGAWMQEADRHVFKDTIGDHWISTVFLGLDHRFVRSWPWEPPILFETMVFCQHEPACELDNKMKRYSTWLEAEAGHRDMVDEVKMKTDGNGDPHRSQRAD